MAARVPDAAQHDFESDLVSAKSSSKAVDLNDVSVKLQEASTTGTLQAWSSGSSAGSTCSEGSDAIDELCINTVRCLCADMVENAKSGHPGAPLGCAPMAHVLYGKVMKFSSADPGWFDRDRFVLSNGHACTLLYSMLHLTGFPLSMDDLKAFRQIGSRTPGHPENFLTAGVELSTGPLGQGLSGAVGLAIAESHLAATYNKPDMKIIDHHTYVICGDGCLQEGVTSEACSLAGHLGLGKLIVLYDDNKITIDGSTDLSFTEDVKARFESYGWQVLEVADGTDSAAILEAVEEAKACIDRPSLLKVHTVIGQGCPSKQGSHTVHGAPLGAKGLEETKAHLGLDPEKSFQVPDAVASHYLEIKSSGDLAAKDWKLAFARYAKSYPAEGAKLARCIAGDLPGSWESALTTYKVDAAPKATRQWSQASLNDLSVVLPELVGGSADLTPSNLTLPKECSDYQKDTPDGRYIRFGVREHGMAAICNGIAAHGGLIPYCATFLNFIGYALGAVRMSALSRLRVLYVMTHDSIGLGEDGPTHQPVEMLECLRSMPNLFVFRPCDGNEVAGSYAAALNLSNSPSVLALSRQSMPIQAKTSIEAVMKGAYVIEDAPERSTAKVILVATGSEVQLAVRAKAALVADGVAAAVVSMPCQELFEQQPLEYKLSVFPEGVPVLSVEASGTMGWERYSHLAVGMSFYGASGPASDLYAKFGFTCDNVVTQAKRLIDFYGVRPAPSLVNRLTSSFIVGKTH
eukprot:gnl/TRDRNA2_/TRDRNA2_65944_c0_seq1.p1 gnl/TRDRNA2_/TRDRNA2_65944_c0~~gnl/TRDRNA2_/TRDRNA2_65944_c0_seq1.p1  ORF type:complete len:746 (-),score=126.52 gnl/TRDRNA2_/TRDRNA2_65944_c0_seq1:664-2901(-)